MRCSILAAVEAGGCDGGDDDDGDGEWGFPSSAEGSGS